MKVYLLIYHYDCHCQNNVGVFTNKETATKKLEEYVKKSAQEEFEDEHIISNMTIEDIKELHRRDYEIEEFDLIEE